MRFSPRSFCLLLSLPFLALLPVRAQNPAPPPAKPPANQKVPGLSLDHYHVDVLPANIAPTPATQPQENIQVFGQPRTSVGHPCTLVDKQDVAELKTLITTNPDAIKAFALLKAACDARIAKPLNVPLAKKGPDGNWMFVGDPKRPFALNPLNEGNAGDMADCGMMYQLTGDEKYANFARQMLIAYADNYNNYGHPLVYWGHPEGAPWTKNAYRSATDGRITSQFLDDGFFLIRAAFAYDLVYELPAWTPADRAHVRDDLLKAVAQEFYDPVEGKENYINATHNRAALCTSGVLIAGYATEDQELITYATYGSGGTAAAPVGGVIGAHFGDKGILPDGLWNEGAPAYQTGIASCGLFNDAETLWHHGIDMYRFRGGVLKRLLDSAIALAYPNPKLLVAALHDSGPFALLDSRAWLNNEIGVPYECGYRRYRDPSYIPIIDNATKLLSMTVHSGGPSLFLDLPAADTVPPRPVENVNFYSVGYGVLRTNTPTGGNQLIQEYGPSGGHSHPSKLAIDVYALGGQTMPFPGVIFPYGNPLDFNWYQVTMGNNALLVDEQSQIYSMDRYKFPRDLPDPDATQLVFAPASTFGMQRAWSNTVQPGVIEDRALFLTPDYLVDIFGGFGNAPHKYDLAWHIRGAMTTTLKADPYQFPAPVAPGYNSINNLTRASSDQAWTATVATPDNQTVRLLAPGGAPTEVFLGTGHYFTKKVTEDENPAVIVERREGQNSALFGTAADLSGDPKGFLQSVTQEGSLDLGYGLLKLQTAKGGDLCFTSFRPGSYTAEGLATDAMEAFVRMDGANVQSMYLGGGTTLKVAGGALQRSTPGLAYVEKIATGYLVGNPSSEPATVTVTLPALAALKAYTLDDQGKRTGPAAPTAGSGGAMTLQLKAASKVEFASP